MKKIFSIFAAALILVGAVSCKNKKDEPSAPKTTFTIEISNITDEGCDFIITPSDNTVEYMRMFMPTEQLDNNTPVEIVESQFSALEVVYTDLKNHGQIHQGRYGDTYKDLIEDTEYVLAVFRIDENLNIVDDVALSKSFYTLPYGYVDLGLPSGILWDSGNTSNSNDADGLFTWEEARDRFSGSLPTEEQYQELLELGNWQWDSYYNGYDVYGPNGKAIWFACTGKYEINNESGAVVVNYDAEGENACCVWSITDHYILKQHNGNFLFFTQTDGPRMKSDKVTKRLAKVHLVAENPNKK